MLNKIILFQQNPILSIRSSKKCARACMCVYLDTCVCVCASMLVRMYVQMCAFMFIGMHVLFLYRHLELS